MNIHESDSTPEDLSVLKETDRLNPNREDPAAAPIHGQVPDIMQLRMRAILLRREIPPYRSHLVEETLPPVSITCRNDGCDLKDAHYTGKDLRPLLPKGEQPDVPIVGPCVCCRQFTTECVGVIYK